MITLTRLTVLLFAAGLTSCVNTPNSQQFVSTPIDTATSTQPKIEIVFPAIDTATSSQTKVVERFFPTEKTVTIADTTDQTSGIRITITESALDSYVTNRHGNDSVEYIDKYRDTEWSVKVLRNNEVLADTVFRKENFGDHLESEFLGVANFHGYWIRKIQPDKIEFFGVIAKPETDWSFAFYHYLDLRTRKFAVKEHVDEEVLEIQP